MCSPPVVWLAWDQGMSAIELIFKPLCLHNIVSRDKSGEIAQKIPRAGDTRRWLEISNS